MATPIPPQVIAEATKLAKDGIVTVLGPALLKQAKIFWSKDPGSKVKKYAYCDCSIELFGNKACIVVDKEQGKVVFLTSEEIASHEFVKEKFRPVTMKMYYYYDIFFKDGRKSRVRMSKEKRDAMLNHT